MKPLLGNTLQLSSLQKNLLNDFQKDFPLSLTPYADIAAQLQVSEEKVLEAFEELSEAQFISRVGAVFFPHRVGTSTLATMAVPKEQLESVAHFVSRLPEVNHNYEREHEFNLWFVMTVMDEEHLQAVLAEIEHVTGIEVISLPMLESYHIDLGFDLTWSHS